MDDDFESLLGDEPSATLPERASTGALAALLGVTPRTITELSRKGVLSPAGRGNWPVRECVARYCAHLREQAAGRTGSTTLTAERIRVAKEQADALELKNAALRGEMLHARQVESEWASILRSVRSAILAVPARLPNLSLQDAQALNREIRNALTEIADNG